MNYPENMPDKEEYARNSSYENHRITLTGRGVPVKFECKENETVLEAMAREGIHVNAACGGRGVCKKCRVQVLTGELPVTTSDQLAFSKEELTDGWRLSCTAIPKGDLSICLGTGDETDFLVVTDYHLVNQEEKSEEEALDGAYAIAIDMGTTTIVISLLDLAGKSILDTETRVNRQRAYGSDVISRIQASNQGRGGELREMIRRDLLEGIQNILNKFSIARQQLHKIVIAGNTTMGHLLLGYSCESLGRFPFTPVNINRIELPFHEVFDCEDLESTVILLPGISAFVGGDIVAGLLAWEFDREAGPCLLVDLGTNGEMAIGGRDRILVTSTAVGPAFEGGNITCGVGSIRGAISNIEIKDDGVYYKTIGDGAPIGICGTGMLELTSELLKTGRMDATGLLESEYFTNGFAVTRDEAGNAITFYQKDIREIQMAKAAIRAGVEILLRRYGCSYKDIDAVYLAGGFGYQIDWVKALIIGLLPQEFSTKIKPVGNSALGGAVRYLMDPSAPDRVEAIRKVSSEIHLSNDEDFQDLYITNMNFI